MAKCEWCNQDMSDNNHDGCMQVEEKIKGVTYKRIPYNRDGYPNPEGRCHDCNCKVGYLYHPGCDMERCAKCGGQSISCGCGYDEEDESEI